MSEIKDEFSQGLLPGACPNCGNQNGVTLSGRTMDKAAYFVKCSSCGYGVQDTAYFPLLVNALREAVDDANENGREMTAHWLEDAERALAFVEEAGGQ